MGWRMEEGIEEEGGGGGRRGEERGRVRGPRRGQEDGRIERETVTLALRGVLRGWG